MSEDLTFENYAEINLDHLRHNINRIRKMIAETPTEIMAVLKADAYGHGAKQIMGALLDMGVRYFAVANIWEGIALRKCYQQGEILVLGNIHPGHIPLALEHNLSLTVFSKEYWEAIAPKLDRLVKIHIKINTGFNRLGFECCPETLDEIKEISQHPCADVEGIFSHFVLKDQESDHGQFDHFMEFLDACTEQGLSFRFRHIADSIAAVRYPWCRLDMVRLGALLYGLEANYPEYEPLQLKGTLKLYASVAQVRRIKQGAAVSYDALFVAPRDMTIAALTFGYADGFPRSAWNSSNVQINGGLAPLIGRICMDQSVADVSSIPEIKLNDRVLVYAIDRDSPVSINRLAVAANTNKNDIIAALASRVTRVYLDSGKQIIENPMLGEPL